MKNLVMTVTKAEPADVQSKATEPDKAAAPPPLARGSWVRAGDAQGRVDLVVIKGVVPGVEQDVAADGNIPALRVVQYEAEQQADGSTAWARSTKRFAVLASEAERIAPLERGQVKDAAEALIALIAEHEQEVADLGLDEQARPSALAVKEVYARGCAAWPGEEKTSLPRKQWGIGRVRAFLDTAAGQRPEGYTKDDDLLPEAKGGCCRSCAEKAEVTEAEAAAEPAAEPVLIATSRLSADEIIEGKINLNDVLQTKEVVTSAAGDRAPGVDGAVGPVNEAQRSAPHVYARDVHSGSGNCVCGRAPEHRMHLNPDGTPVDKPTATTGSVPYVEEIKHLPGLHDQSMHGHRSVITNPDGSVTHYTEHSSITTIPYVEGPPESLGEIVRNAGGLRKMAREEFAVLARDIALLVSGAGAGGFKSAQQPTGLAADPHIASVMAALDDLVAQDLDLLDHDVFNALIQRLRDEWATDDLTMDDSEDDDGTAGPILDPANMREVKRGWSGIQFDPRKHPRGQGGRFIKIGDHVTLPDGATGRVTKVGEDDKGTGIARVKIDSAHGGGSFNFIASGLATDPGPRAKAKDGHSIVPGDMVMLEDGQQAEVVRVTSPERILVNRLRNLGDRKKREKVPAAQVTAVLYAATGMRDADKGTTGALVT